MAKKWLTVGEVARRYGIKDYQVRYAVKVGYLKTRKKGWIILIKADQLPKTWPVKKGV